MQSLEALAAFVRIQTRTKDRISFLGLETEAQTISRWIDFVTSFYKEADSSMQLVNAARDFAMSLAQLYTGQRSLLFNIHLFDVQLYLK